MLGITYTLWEGQRVKIGNPSGKQYHSSQDCIYKDHTRQQSRTQRSRKLCTRISATSSQRGRHSTVVLDNRALVPVLPLLLSSVTDMDAPSTCTVTWRNAVPNVESFPSMGAVWIMWWPQACRRPWASPLYGYGTICPGAMSINFYSLCSVCLTHWWFLFLEISQTKHPWEISHYETCRNIRWNLYW